MISRLRGTPSGRTADGLVLDVGGVGYLVAATPSALRRAENAHEITLETYLHVREDALQLYGFSDPAERELFLQLLGVSGIGPAIPGIGKKTAERIVLELKGSIGDAIEPGGGEAIATDLVAREALVELGYSLVEAERALAAIDPELSPAERVREALRSAA